MVESNTSTVEDKPLFNLEQCTVVTWYFFRFFASLLIYFIRVRVDIWEWGSRSGHITETIINFLKKCSEPEVNIPIFHTVLNFSPPNEANILHRTFEFRRCNTSKIASNSTDPIACLLVCSKSIPTLLKFIGIAVNPFFCKIQKNIRQPFKLNKGLSGQTMSVWFNLPLTLFVSEFFFRIICLICFFKICFFVFFLPKWGHCG